MFHFFNCAILTFGPHAVYYSATPLSSMTLWERSSSAFSLSFQIEDLLKALIGFIDVAGLYFALTQVTHWNISQNHKFQAVGLDGPLLILFFID
ncbi:hypothetical protein MLD38_024759 [Melastoma candidum]|uniref:Uncharacterized protein n=1 Tax=Melastoma candidum TaxID=119954 RepID=A0ACB9NV07_9MYRT|nr:hypothetical protein MLD38_024759 [Melastoma candidum]